MTTARLIEYRTAWSVAVEILGCDDRARRALLYRLAAEATERQPGGAFPYVESDRLVVEVDSEEERAATLALLADVLVERDLIPLDVATYYRSKRIPLAR